MNLPNHLRRKPEIRRWHTPKHCREQSQDDLPPDLGHASHQRMPVSSSTHITESFPFQFPLVRSPLQSSDKVLKVLLVLTDRALRLVKLLLNFVLLFTLNY